MKYVWLEIRSMIPNENFKIPRWHTDNWFYRETKPQYKIASVLKG